MGTRIRIKRGTESQITGYAGPHYEGELAYATNTGGVFVNDGTQFITVGGSSETPTLQSVTDAGNTTTNSIEVSKILVGDGSYAAPAISFQSDTNTGIYRNAENELDIVAGGGRFRIDGTRAYGTIGGAFKINLTYGQASAPTYSFNGYDNNGMFRPMGINAVAFSTAGTEKLRITQDGNVGIGTTSPSEKLEVIGNIKVSNGNDNISIIPNNSTGSISTTSQAVQGAIVSAVSDGFTFASRNVYGGVNIGSFNNSGTVTLGAFAYGNVNYQTAHNSFAHTWYGSRASDPWMTLNSTGLGIGTTSPSSLLHINTSYYAPITIGETTDATTKYNNIVSTQYSSTTESEGFSVLNTVASSPYNNLNIGGGKAENNAATQISFFTGATTSTRTGSARMTITKDGNVGIGTTVPTFGLDIHKSGDAFRVATNGGYDLFSVKTVTDQSSSYTTNTAGNSQIYSTFLSSYNYQSFSALYARGFKGQGANNAIGIRAVRAEHGVGYGAQGSVEYSRGVESKFNTLSTGVGSINNIYGFYNSAVNTGVTINNQYGLYLSDNPVATNNYGVYQAGTSFKNIFEGKVGIGTTAPSEKLEVSGNIKLTNEGVGVNKEIVIAVNGGNETARILYDTNVLGRRWQTGSVSANNSYNFSIGTDTNPNYFVIERSAGKVGIGTTAPTEKLHVAGNAKVDGTLVIDTAKITDINGQVYLDNLTNGGDIFIRTRDDQGGVDTGILINGTDKTVSLHYNTIAKLITAVDGVAVTGNIKINGNDQYIYGPSNTENIRFYTPNNQIILSATNGIRFGSDILLNGAEKSISTDIGDKYFQFYNQTYDGFDRVIRQYEPIVKETSTEPAIISRADLEFRIDSNNDSTTSAFKITKDAGTELMRVNEAGNVGIGTTSPTEKLQVSGGNILLDTNTWIGSGSSSGQPRLRFDNTNSQGKLQQADLVLNDEKSIAWSNTGTSIQGRGVDNQRIEFNVASSERMRITSAGNVGIGTTSPSSLLTLGSAGTLATGLILDNAGSKGYLFGDGSTMSLRAGSSYGITISTGSAALHAFNTTGNFLINLQAPTTYPIYSFYQDADTGIGRPSADKLAFYAGGERMRIDSTGNLGIGTTSPTAKLHVSTTSGTAFKVNPNDTNREWYIDTTNPDHLKKGQNLILHADPTGVHTSTFISFNIDGSNKMHIQHDGAVGIGTTSPTSNLNINGSAMRQLRLQTSGGPSSNTDTAGNVGDIAYDDLYFYIKTTNGWGRVPLDFGF